MSKRAVIYTRAATEDPIASNGCDDQAAECLAHCRTLGHNVVAVIHDRSFSGTMLQRPGWRQVEAFLVADAADIVVSTSVDRVSCELEELSRLCSRVMVPLDKDIELSTLCLPAPHSLKRDMTAFLRCATIPTPQEKKHANS